MQTKRAVRIVGTALAFIVAAILFTGCTTYRAYTGAALPRKQVAVLTLAEGWSPQPVDVEVVKIDGNDINGAPVGTGQIRHKIELLPGQHTIRFSPILVHIFNKATGDSIDKTFFVEAGKNYRYTTTLQESEKNDTWDIEIIEIKSLLTGK